MSVRKRILPRGWYPGSADECAGEIEGFLAGFTPPPGPWLGGVAPHAGWFFSGKAAARVVRTLSESQGMDRVVVYGGHLPGGRSPLVYVEESWETPFGPQPMDASLSGELVSSGAATSAPKGFSDNTVEVLLPFVKRFFPDTPIIAVHSPSSQGALHLSAALDDLLEARKLTAVYMGSADLTHYGPNYGFSPKGTGSQAVKWVKEENDRSIVDKALAMDSQGVLNDANQRHNTCSAGPIASVIASAARHKVEKGLLLDYYTSFDIIPNSSFVGYAAIVY